MIEMIEVVGVSTESFSDAIKNAVQEKLNSGKKVSWFEVVEHRGGIKNGTIEYQAKVKLAVFQ